MSAEMLPPEVGQILNGKYRLERILGEGVMGTVFQALNTRLGHHVAIKAPKALVLAEPALRERFEREAKAAARLRHRNSARVIDVENSEQGVPYMVMELLQGHDLETEIQERGQLPIGEAVAYVVQASSAMVEAHGRGIVHRDLKPSNLFLATEADGTVCLKVLDFGISKFQSEKVNLTAPLAQVGTPLYMSPEQVRASKTQDERTDIWSMGIILYELLAGEPPFTGSATGIGAAIVSDMPTPIRQCRPDVPAALEQAICGPWRRIRASASSRCAS
ncbi:MAG: serine/threonine-protein kinase [Polyangiaceae bacterium]